MVASPETEHAAYWFGNVEAPEDCEADAVWSYTKKSMAARGVTQEWDSECISTENKSSELWLVQNYKGLDLYDPDTDVGTLLKVLAPNVEWKKKDKSSPKTPCYALIVRHVRGEDSDDDSDDGGDGDNEYDECYHINADPHSMIRDARSNQTVHLRLMSA